jgi:choline-sulfatase
MGKNSLILLALLASATAQVRPASPDVVLITIDTLRADRVGCYGYPAAQTPNLDRLCSLGVRAEQAFTASPITNTSHASIMTGLYPSRHGVADFAIPLASTHVTLAERLKKAGYKTAAFIGAVILDSAALAPGMDRGFDHYDNFPAKTDTKDRWERVERRAEAVVAKANAWLSANAGGPRFVWVHLYDPHDPYEAPPPFGPKFTKNPYDGEVAYTDAAIGKLIATLEKQQRFDPTLLVVMSDHGEGLGEHGENTHGIFLYDSTLHIPLVFKLPGNANKGRAFRSQVSSVDIMPTILELIQLPVPSVDGKSLAKLIRQEIDEERPVFAETDYPVRFGWAPLKAVRRSGAKYIEAPRPEFYDLTADPKEERNLYAPWEERVQKIRAVLADFRDKSPKATNVATAPVDPKTIAELKALGYLGTNPGETTVAEPSILPDPKDKIEIQNLIHAGMMAEESGDMKSAHKSFAAAVEADPTSAIARRQLGSIAYKTGEYKEAALHLSHAYAQQPSDSSVALMLGQTLEKTGDFKAARDVLEANLKQTPGQYDGRVALGRVYHVLGNNAAAHDQLEAAVFLDGKRIDARIALAKLLLAEGKTAEARKELQRALAVEPKNPELAKLLAQAK